MKKLVKLFIIATLAVCGVSCELLGGLINGGNNNGENGENNGNGNGGTTTSYVISVTNITTNSATVTVTPSDNDTSYYFDVIEKDYLDAYTNSADFLADYVAEIKAYIDELNAYGYGITFADFVSYGKDSYDYEAGTLDPNTEYYAIAFGLSEEGKVTSDLNKKVFTTLSSGNSGGSNTSNNTFQVNVTDITSNGATVSVTPSNYDTYYFDVIEKDIYDMYTDKKELAADYMAEIAEACKDYGYTIADVLSSGSDAYSFEGYLDPNTAYYALAFGVSTSGAITTDVAATAFTTLASGSGGGSTGGNTGDKNLTCFELGYYENWGDYYGTNATNWYIDLYSLTSNDYFVLELQGALGDTAPVAGEYKLLSTFAPGTAVAGGIDNQGYVYGTYWALLNDNWDAFVDYSLCTSGTVKVSKSDNIYTIDIDAVGQNGEAIKVSYAGTLEEYVSDYSLAAQKLSNNLTKRFCTVSRMMKQKQVKIAPKAMLKKATSTLKFSPKKVAPKSELIKRNFAR